MQGVTYGKVWVFVSVEVATTGVTIGIVLQMTVEEVSWRVMTVAEVTTEVLVFVLVTMQRISLSSGFTAYGLHLPTVTEVTVLTTVVTTGLYVVVTLVMTVGFVEVQVEGL